MTLMTLASKFSLGEFCNNFSNQTKYNSTDQTHFGAYTLHVRLQMCKWITNTVELEHMGSQVM